MLTSLATYLLQADGPSIDNGIPDAPVIPPEVDAERRRIITLGQLGFTLPGSIVTRTVTCGRATCRCATDPDQRHDPYIQWSRTVQGRTVNKLLTPQQLETYQPWDRQRTPPMRARPPARNAVPRRHAHR